MAAMVDAMRHHSNQRPVKALVVFSLTLATGILLGVSLVRKDDVVGMPTVASAIPTAAPHTTPPLVSKVVAKAAPSCPPTDPELFRLGVVAPLVTGCGRSGTHTIAKLLNNIGVPSEHEGWAPGSVSVSWLYAHVLADGRPEESRYPFEGVRGMSHSAYIRRRKSTLREFAPVVHLVRFPLDVIHSTRGCFCAAGVRETATEQRNDKSSWRFVERTLGELQTLLPGVAWSDLKLDDLRRSMAYWVGWNRKIEATFGKGTGNCLVRFRLEDLDTLSLAEALIGNATNGRVHSAGERGSIAGVHGGKTKPSLKISNPPLTWSDLYDASPGLATEIWEMAKEYGYATMHPELQGTLKHMLEDTNADGRRGTDNRL